MSEPADRNWTMTFPIEATVFVALLVLISVVAVITFFATQWYPFGGGGDFVAPMPAVDEFPRSIPDPPLMPETTTIP